MKKKFFSLILSAAIFTTNPLFAMEDLPDDPKGMTVVQRNDALPDDDLVGSISILPPEDLTHIFSFVSSRSELIPLTSAPKNLLRPST